MNKKLKSLTLLMLIAALALASTISVSAAELSSLAVYDLQKGGIQSFTIKSETSEFQKVTIEKISCNARMNAGTYRVLCENINWTAGFYLVISNNQIGAVYNPFYSTVAGSISSTSLAKNNPTMATYSFLYKLSIMTYDTGVVAKIVNSNLVVNQK